MFCNNKLNHDDKFEKKLLIKFKYSNTLTNISGAEAKLRPFDTLFALTLLFPLTEANKDPPTGSLGLFCTGFSIFFCSDCAVFFFSHIPVNFNGFMINPFSILTADSAAAFVVNSTKALPFLLDDIINTEISPC